MITLSILNSDLIPCRARHKRASLLIVALLATAGVCLAQEPPGALQEQFDEATQLAKSPDGTAAATEQLQSIVKAHLANQEIYERALQQIDDLYRKANRDEDALRYFIGLIGKQSPRDSHDVLRKILEGYQLRSPELFNKMIAELGPNHRERKQLERIAPAADLQAAILQRRDPQLRDGALAKLRENLAPDMPDNAQRSALATLGAVLPAKFDRQPFRPLVLPLLASKSAQVRSLALQCLPGLAPEPSDLEAIAPLTDDPSPEVRQAVAGALVSIGDGKHADIVVPALVKVFSDADPQVIEASLRSIWGQYSEAKLDERLIALSRDPKHHGNAIYHGLSTQRTKSKPVCERLVEELDDSNWNNSNRAAWGLTFGVVDEAKSLVEAGLLRALPEETNPHTRREEFRALAKVASQASREYLKSVVASPTETDAAKQAAHEILGSLKKP